MQKHRQNTTEKHKAATRKKTKVRPRKWIQKPNRRRTTQKNRRGTSTNTPEATKTHNTSSSSCVKARRAVSGIALRKRDFVSRLAQERERERRRRETEREKTCLGEKRACEDRGGRPVLKGTPAQKGPLAQKRLGVPATPTQTPEKKHRSRQGEDQPSTLEGLP